MALDHRFGEALSLELKRQGLADSGAWYQALIGVTKYVGPTTASPPKLQLLYSHMMVGDKVIIAVCEAILKTVQMPIAADANWILQFNGNGLTDKVAAPIALVLSSCTGLSKLDLMSNQFTDVGYKIVLDSWMRLVNRPQLLVPSQPTPQQQLAAPSQSHGSNTSSVKFQTASNHSQHSGAGSTNSTDMVALRRRRDQLLRDEGIVNIEEAKKERDALKQELFAQQPSVSPQNPQQQKQSLFPAEDVPFVEVLPVDSHPAQPARQGSMSTTHVTHDAPQTIRSEQMEKQATPQQRPAKPQSAAQQPQPAAATAGKRAAAPPSAAQAPSTNQQKKVATPQPAAAPTAAPVKHTPKKSGSSPPSAARRVLPHDNILDGIGDSSPEAGEGDTTPKPSDRHGGGGGGPSHHHAAGRTFETADVVTLSETGSSPAYETAATESTMTDFDEGDSTDPLDFIDVTDGVGKLDTVLNLCATRVPHTSAVHRNSLQFLTVLNIAQNGLTELAQLPPTLVRLDASGNELTAITGLGPCSMLSVLNLRRNKIKRLSGLDTNVHITSLFLGRNPIRFVDNLAHLWMLETLDISHTQLTHLSDIRPISVHTMLKNLLLHSTPFHKKMGSRYRPTLRNLCAALVGLDGNKVPFSKASREAVHNTTSMNMTGGIGMSMIQDASSIAVGSYMPVASYAAPGKVQNTIGAIQRRKLVEEARQRKQRLHVSRHDLMQRRDERNKSFVQAAMVEKLVAGNGGGSQYSVSPDSTRPSTRTSPSQTRASPLRVASPIRRSHTLDMSEWSHIGAENDAPPKQQQQQQTQRPNTAHPQAKAVATTNARRPVPKAGGYAGKSPTPAVKRTASSPPSTRKTPGGGAPPTERIANEAADAARVILNIASRVGRPLTSPQKYITSPEYLDDDTLAVEEIQYNTRQGRQQQASYPLLQSGRQPQSRTPTPQKNRPASGGRSGRTPSPERHVRFSPTRTREDSDEEPVEASKDAWVSALPKSVREWVVTAQRDVAAVRLGLKTILVVLESVPRKQSDVDRCCGLIVDNHLLDDTEVPEHVVYHFNFTQTEMNNADFPVGPTAGHAQDPRYKVLALLHDLGECKTCMRYLFALLESNREDLLAQYVGSVKDCIGL